jgi:CAAX prenyl protease-like protein
MPMIPYVLPFILYLVASQVCATFPKYFAFLYPSLMLFVAATTAVLLYRRRLLQPHWRIVPAVLVGLVGIALWIAICRLEWDQVIDGFLPTWLRPSLRPGFDPFTAINDNSACWAFIAARLAGLALLVPVVEELFWRGFLARWLISPDWQKQPIGRFTPFSFAGVTLLFTLAHPEWLAAAVYCVLLNLLLAWTRDLWSCVVAHGVSNLVLGIYILATGNWQLW